MNVEELRKELASGKPVIGSWLQLPSPDAAEIMADAGYDWLAVDMEHGGFSRGELADMFRAIGRGGACPFARLPEAARGPVKAALEAGARGLIFPMIESREQLDAAIAEALYPDAGGVRGTGYCRANGFGKHFASYRQAAADIFLVAQIEHIRAVERLDEILSHPRLDAVMVGPYDLSASLGVRGEKTGLFEDPEVRDVLRDIALAAARHHVPMGIHVVAPEPGVLKRYIAEGCQFIAYGIDTVFLWKQALRPVL